MKSYNKIFLGGENISKGGFLEELKCISCNFTSKRLILQSDTDMVYMGVVGLTDIKEDRILITHLNKEEWDNFKDYLPEKLEERINKEMKSSNFVYFKFGTKMNDDNELIKKISCPKCSGSLEKSCYQSFENYIENGGEILTLDESKLDSYKNEK